MAPHSRDPHSPPHAYPTQHTRATGGSAARPHTHTHTRALPHTSAHTQLEQLCASAPNVFSRAVDGRWCFRTSRAHHHSTCDATCAHQLTYKHARATVASPHSGRVAASSEGGPGYQSRTRGGAVASVGPPVGARRGSQCCGVCAAAAIARTTCAGKSCSFARCFFARDTYAPPAPPQCTAARAGDRPRGPRRRPRVSRARVKAARGEGCGARVDVGVSET